MSDLTTLTIVKAHEGLIKKEFSALELTKAYLDRIREEDEKIHAFLVVLEELAFSQAKEIDDLISLKKETPLLAGIPLAIKDNILIDGIKCTAASKILEDYTATYDATCIKKLKNAGAVFLGKVNLDEFAMGSSCENSAFVQTRNPHDLNRVPGGSSGGSAASVSARLSAGALGSDTGGSIRLPASFCGVVGMKPTYGRVSRYGLIAMASSLDQIGPFAKTVEDAEIIFKTICGEDSLDSTSIEREDIKREKFDIKKLRIGVPKEYFIEGMNLEVEKNIRQAIKKYEELGVKIEEVSLPHTEYAMPVYYIICASEVSSNMARYDGIRYGKRSSKGENLLDTYLNSKSEGLGDEVRRRVMLGTYVLSSGYYDAYYVRAQKIRSLIKQDFDKAFKKVDIILTPTSPCTAFSLGEKTKDPLTMYLSDVFVGAVNLAGLPAISIPCGKVDNLPVGLQLIGKPFDEKTIFEAGKIAENFQAPIMGE